jgi:hypothetical protein
MTYSPTTSPAPVSEPETVDTIAAELVRRLRPVLGAMPEDEFLDLVRVMAERQERWLRRERAGEV